MGKFNKDGTFTIKKDSVNRWKRQMNTLYNELPENEKDSDRKEADLIIEIVNDLKD
jgi:hypothetical protein